MTEPKEEKCEACCGSGYINFWTDDGHISMRTCRRCDGYGYIKAKPMTNEEWFCGLSTEEKAKFLRQIYRDGRDDYVGEWYEQTEADFVEWLKQPHSGE